MKISAADTLFADQVPIIKLFDQAIDDEFLESNQTVIIETMIEPKDLIVKVEKRKFRRILAYILQNDREAVVLSGGRITLTARPLDQKTIQISVHNTGYFKNSETQSPQ